ncbi:serine/threonine-protein phosphatase 6 regulatory subunit 2 isoform X3 [Monodelphis domestica]|uniref:serine/threonine-protein phosphatase 6 regulatory subunit 2 isoform X3 n=1 Tax=Monodelphis domestica TaxID=13616 RepID=UPI0024E1E281|nr:serine/threonine-protein phosphatase 6 regulatory subunit 2 isoform X3 [Monodelphis domestica]
MFWKFDLNTTSHVDKLLEKEDVTLHELMDEDDILQECKAQNRKLLDFLCKQQCMEELVSLITHDPPLDMEEKVRFKYPNTACELLTSDVPQINDKLGGDETLLNILYDFLDHEPPLNPLLASFFSKTIGNLIARKTEQVITFLKKKDQFISLVLKHIDTSAMMDLLLRLISCVEPAALRQEVLNWLNEENVIERLVQLIHSSQDEDRQSNASQTLCDIIRLSRDQGSQTQEISEPDPLLTALESQECVEQLLKNMFDGDVTENCLVNGTQILLTLLETRRSGVEGLVDSFSQGFERSYTVNSSILHGIEPWLKDFHQLLLTPPKKMSILTTIGILEEPLGNARLHGARLIAALLHTNTPSINQELCRLNTMDLLLDLFFKFTWNNFLHFQVELCVAAILSHSAREGGMLTKEADSREDLPNGNGSLEKTECAEVTSENVMVTHLFQKCCLVQRILDAWEANDRIQAEGGMRRGNMGHLTRIANAVVQNMEKGPIQTQISSFIKELPEDCRGRWESFVEETLPETNRRNTVDLVSTHHLHSSSEDEDMESAFPNELSLQQAFSEYQIQQMTANFVDQFGFNDEEFADQDDNINAPFDRIAEINFTIDADDDSHAAVTASSPSMTMRRRRTSGRTRRSTMRPRRSPGPGLVLHIPQSIPPKVIWRTGIRMAARTPRRRMGGTMALGSQSAPAPPISVCRVTWTPPKVWPWTSAPVFGMRPPPPTPALPRKKAGPNSPTFSPFAAQNQALDAALLWTREAALRKESLSRARTRPSAQLPLVSGMCVWQGRPLWWPPTAALLGAQTVRTRKRRRRRKRVSSQKLSAQDPDKKASSQPRKPRQRYLSLPAPKSLQGPPKQPCQRGE